MIENKKLERVLLLTAGPANIAELLVNVRKKLVKISGGDPREYTSTVFVNSGTGAIESVLGSIIHNKELLIIVNGVYGERIRSIAKTLNVPHQYLEYGHDKIPNLSEIENLLKDDENIGYIAMVHMETTLGKINPMHDVGMLAKKYNKTYIVDAMASFATESLNVKKDNIDFCIANSNKGIQGVPGLSFAIIKKTELDKIKNTKPKSLYLDLYAQYKMEEEKGQTPYTPAIQSFFALDQALDELNEEGVNNRINRYDHSSKTLIKGMEKIGIYPYLPLEFRSKTLTTFVLPKDISYDELSEKLKEERYVIYPGKGPSADHTFRIGNLGIVNRKHIENFLQTFEKIFNRIKNK
jgi:2-aminoethylphosphonate-pyruvate transaminase